MSFIIQKKTYTFDLEYFNKITKGGVPDKTLNIALAGTGVGKSLFMCHVAANALLKEEMFYILLWKWQKNVLQNVLMLIY